MLILAPLATVGVVSQISEHTPGAEYRSPLDSGRSVEVAVNVADAFKWRANCSHHRQEDNPSFVGIVLLHRAVDRVKSLACGHINALTETTSKLHTVKVIRKMGSYCIIEKSFPKTRPPRKNPA